MITGRLSTSTPRKYALVRIHRDEARLQLAYLGGTERGARRVTTAGCRHLRRLRERGGQQPCLSPP